MIMQKWIFLEKSLSFILGVTIFIGLERECWSLMRRVIEQNVHMKNALSSILILTLLLTKPVGTVMDKASVLEVFRYRSPWSLYDLVS